MATDTQPDTTLRDAAVDGLLDRLRGRVRAYVWLQGLAIVVACLGLAFWVRLLIDQPWVFEPPRPVRAALLVVGGLALIYLVYRVLLRRAFVRLSRRNMAMLLERRYRRFDDSLLTTVELEGRDPAALGFSGEMLAHTSALARRETADVDLGQVFNWSPLARAAIAGVLLAGSVMVFAAALPDAFGVWFRRNLLLSSELWPRKTELLVEGFRDGVARIARGSDFTVIAKADTAKLVPTIVQVRYRTDEGFRARENMTQDGVARAGIDPYQQFSHTFQGVLTPIWLDVVGGDDRERDLRIEVVDSPTFAEMRLECRFPTYMSRQPRSVPVTGAMQLPEGTQVTLHARANKDLTAIEMRAPSPETSTGSATNLDAQSFAIDPAGDRRDFQVDLGVLTADRTLLFTLLDADGIRNRDPIRLALGVTPDQPPQVSVQLRGIGSAVTPQARVPVAGELSDDYGLAAAWFEYVIDEGADGAQPSARPLANEPRGRDTLTIDDASQEALDLRDQLTNTAGERLELKPGQKLLVAVKARDAYDLGAAPHEGGSQRFLLDVVTPDQLRTLLESRELNLRRRFETIIEEVTETSDTLATLDLAAAAGESPPPADNEASEDESADEPGDEDDAGETPARAAELVALRVERAVQNSSKNAQETLGVAVGFDDITAELINNRVDTEELRSRLTDGIASPLKHIALDLFPVLDQKLAALRTALADPATAGSPRDAARQQAEAVLAEMRLVLNKMLELETFNEALAMLRSIIDSHDKLSERTERLRRQNARNLLEEDSP